MIWQKELEEAEAMYRPVSRFKRSKLTNDFPHKSSNLFILLHTNYSIKLPN